MTVSWMIIASKWFEMTKMRAHSDHRFASKITVMFLKLVFVPFGIFIEPGRKRFERGYTSAFLFVFLTLFAGQVKGYESLDSLLYVLDNTMYVIATTVATIFLIKARRNEDIFERFYGDVISEEYAAEEFFDETDARFKRLAVCLGPVIVISLIGVIVYPIMNAVCTNVDLGSPSTLIYLSYYPWKIDSIPKYIGTVVLQVCSGSVVCSVVGCMIFFLLYCIVVLEAHRNILAKKMERVDGKVVFIEADPERVRKQYDALRYNRRCGSDQKAIDELMMVVKYHQFVNRFANDIISCCTCIVDTSTGAVFSCIVLLITMFLMSPGNYMYQLKVVSMSMVTFCLFSVECYIGEILRHVNTGILLQAYDTKWYKRSLRFRNLMLILMTRCQLPFRIRAFNMLNVNFLFFTTLLKNIYSVLQFILRMQNDENV